MPESSAGGPVAIFLALELTAVDDAASEAGREEVASRSHGRRVRSGASITSTRTSGESEVSERDEVSARAERHNDER